jgi:hypothetical protein
VIWSYFENSIKEIGMRKKRKRITKKAKGPRGAVRPRNGSGPRPITLSPEMVPSLSLSLSLSLSS